MGARVYACRRQLWFSAEACRNKFLRSAGKAKQHRPVGREDKGRDPPCAVSVGKDKNWDKPLALDANVSYEPWML